MTVYQNATLLQQMLWYNTGGANYSDASALTYDVCGIVLPPFNYFATERAASDNGDCMTALDQACVTDINDLAKEKASNVLTSLQSTENMSAKLPEVCSDVGETLVKQLPSSCRGFFNTTVDAAQDTTVAAIRESTHKRFPDRMS